MAKRRILPLRRSLISEIGSIKILIPFVFGLAFVSAAFIAAGFIYPGVPKMVLKAGVEGVEEGLVDTFDCASSEVALGRTAGMEFCD